MQRITLARLVLSLALVGALALAGCGGDDGGLSAEDMARIESAEAAAAAAMAAETSAKAAQMEAEADAAAAYAAQMTAESEAADAMAAEMAAKAAQATPKRTTAAEAAQAMAEANAAAAVAAQAVAESEAKMAMAAQTAAVADLEAAKTALAAANEAKTMAETAKAVAESEAKMAMAAQMAAVAAQEKAEMAQKVAEDAKMAAETALKTAQDERDRYKMMYEEATNVPSVGTQVGAEGRANSWRISRSVLPAETVDSATTEMMAARIKKGVSAAKLMRDDDGVSFTVMEGTLARMTTTLDTADDAAPSLTGLQGTALAKTAGGTSQNALVYTDIERSVTPFSSKHPYTVDSAGMANTSAARTHFYATATGTLTITGASAHDYISLDHAVSSANTMQMAVTSIRGSYDGVPGVYTCTTGAGCDILWGSTGVMVTVSEHLLFQADDISTLIPDPDYQTFGVWMIAQDGPVTGNSGLIRPIATANASMFGQEDLAAAGIIGSAAYKGRATGYYATRNAGSFEAESGRFTATATLMASFDVAGGGGGGCQPMS